LLAGFSPRTDWTLLATAGVRAAAGGGGESATTPSADPFLGAGLVARPTRRDRLSVTAEASLPIPGLGRDDEAEVAVGVSWMFTDEKSR